MSGKEKQQWEKSFEIFIKKGMDPLYIEKSKKSICKDCVHNLGFNDEFYDCDIYKEVLINYKRVGVFHTEIIKCNKFEPGIKENEK